MKRGADQPYYQVARSLTPGCPWFLLRYNGAIRPTDVTTNAGCAWFRTGSPAKGCTRLTLCWGGNRGGRVLVVTTSPGWRAAPSTGLGSRGGLGRLLYVPLGCPITPTVPKPLLRLARRVARDDHWPVHQAKVYSAPTGRHRGGGWSLAEATELNAPFITLSQRASACTWKTRPPWMARLQPILAPPNGSLVLKRAL